MANYLLETSDFEDLDITHQCLDDSEQYFAQTIGCIEDILMDDEFTRLHDHFMEKYWHEFDDNEENKLIYMEIFNDYIETIEKYIEKKLKQRISDFSMNQFERELKQRRNELDGEIFEILATFSDFLSFKTKFLEYKAMKEGRTLDLSQELLVTKYHLQNNPI